MMNLELDELLRLVRHIQTVYNNLTSEWNNLYGKQVNLKRVHVSDIDEDIYTLILSYSRFLNEKVVLFEPSLFAACNNFVTARVKARSSIEYKLNNYQTSKHEYGRVSINKCMNDLYGVRFVANSPVSYDEICSCIRDNFDDSFRCVDSTKMDYCATHIYIKRDNFSFPWELQVWNSCNVETNLASHEKYKQDYTKWESEAKGGFKNG